MAFELDIGWTTLAGRKPGNEDFCAAMLPEKGREGMGAIVAIADGVSAGGMGREAAQTTVTSLVRDYYGTPETWDTTVALDRIIAAQNSWLCGINQRRQPLVGLTTLTALVLRGQSYTLAHVGDSRAYLLRGGTTSLLTHDHVVSHSDFRHQLLRAVGAENHVVVDYMQGELQVGDVFVLVTDGVHGVAGNSRFEKKLAEILASGATRPAGDAARDLVDDALAQGSTDNATAVVVRVLALLDATLQDITLSARTLPIPPLLKVGSELDGFAVTSLIADNGINRLYQVRDSQSKRLYALKALNPARAHDQQERAMLAHESWVAARMQSGRAADYLVTLHERLPADRERSAFYLLYDWHGGETLQQQLDRSYNFSVTQVTAIAIRVARVLGLLHRQCVIHRDVKPANLHQGDDGILRLLDLGVALSGREPEAMRGLHAGTPSYINPEQWGFNGAGTTEAEPKPADTQSDLFALGVTLYRLLCGRLPYGEVLPYQVGRYYRDPVPPSRINPEVPIWLDHVLLKSIGRDYRQRFETAEEMLLALERGASRPLTATQPTPLMQRDPAAFWKIALALSVLLNMLLVYWLLFLPRI